METAVLPARDHLAEHQYRHHTRAVSGLVSPAGANPRSRRKAGKATPPAVIASIVSDAARMCLTGSFGAPNSAADLSSGVFRGASAPASPRGRFPGSPSFASAGPFFNRAGPSFSSAKSPSHAFHHGPVSSASQASLGGHYHGAGQGRAGVLPRPTPENATGALERMYAKKASDKRSTEVLADRSSERGSERRTLDKKVSENARSAIERRSGKANIEASAVDRKFPRPSEAFVKKDAGDRKFGADRKMPDRERASPHSENHRTSGVKIPKPKNAAAPAGAITILRRPQSREAAAENLAIITGVPLSEICMKNGLVTRQMPAPAEPSTSSTEEAIVSQLKKTAVTEHTECTKPVGCEGAGKNADAQHTRKVGHLADAFAGKGGFLADGIKAETPLKKPSVSSREMDVAQFAEFSLQKLEAQQEPSGASGQSAPKKVDNAPKYSRTRPSDSKNGHHGKGGDSPAKESARMVSKLLEGSSSLTLVSPGSVSSAANPLKSSGGSFGFIDGFHDISFFAPRSPANERWAGPAYSNSPPPSSLPFPTFSLQKLRDASLGELDALAGETVSLLDFPDTMSLGGSSSSSAPSSPSRGSVVLSSDDGQQPLPDVSHVTRDLRRMLNLDLSGNLMLSSNVASDDVKESLATQGLKRILQLG